MAGPDFIRQHLIDPELCIRCNTCEETCPVGAVSHDRHNYVVDPARCAWCRACIDPCPTGAIDHYRVVPRQAPYGLDSQRAWDALPAPQGTRETTPPPTAPAHPLNLVAPAPRSAATPVVQRHPPGHPARAVVVATRRANGANGESDIREIELDLAAAGLPWLEGQSLGIVPPGFDAEGRPHAMRLYSVACARDGAQGKTGHATLLVKRVSRDRAGSAVHGLCSNYLCDLTPGDTLAVHGPYGSRYLMPEDDVPLLLIGTGTGIAPLRAMIDRRLRHASRYRTQMHLFIGTRTAADLPWLGELLPRPGRPLHTHLAFSRAAGQPGRHVQDALREEHTTVFGLLADAACHLYVCGRKDMEAGLHATFAEICQRHGDDWHARLPALAASGRFQLETF